MRILKFIVDDQIVSEDPNCDFRNLVPGTEGHVIAEFIFSSVWNGCVKVASFYSILGKEFTPQILKDGKSCIIPVEALKNRVFKIKLTGQKDNFKITTNKVAVVQDGDKR